MTNNIDRLADDRARNLQSPGEEFHDGFLMKRPKNEWAPYIDETAKDISANISISNISLAKDNFGREVGSYYRRGLEKSTGEYTDLPDILGEHISDEQLGMFAYQLNELGYEVTKDAGLENVQQAIVAVIEKLLTKEVGESVRSILPEDNGTVSDITMRMFTNETIAANIDKLLEDIEQNAGKGLLTLMDEPQMMTTLWEHQQDALQAWQQNDFRGYVDMATATGKTVLGLGAIALKYGDLHPSDRDLIEANLEPNGGREDVLIVAHNDLILEQWRREFDRHLNIPEERTSGSDDIRLSWGRIHFRTPQSLVNEEWLDYDLVLLDEAHHYATASEWGTLLEAFDCDVLAMSGSVDDAGSESSKIQERLSNGIGPRLKRYTITEAREDGVIPSFDWEVRYAPFDGDSSDLEKTSKRAEESFEDIRRRLERGELDIETDRRLETYQDFRTFSHTTTGNELKQRDEPFRNLTTRLFSRRTKYWNLSPSLDAIVDIVLDHITTEKVVVLADSNAQVKELESRLTEKLGKTEHIYVVSRKQESSEQRDIVDQFDEPGESAVLLGTGDLLGEGVDMQNAEVAINMATGSVNPELVQRIGRILRSSDDPKHAMFYNVVGIPKTPDAAVFREDGKKLIENAASFCELGSRFEKLPGFSIADSVNREMFDELLHTGAGFIEQLDETGQYEWTINDHESDHLRALHDEISDDRGSDEILGSWEEYAWEHSKDDINLDDPTGANSETDVDTEELTEISGVNSSRAIALREAGYETIEDIRFATQPELSSIDDIGPSFAARIKADVGDSDPKEGENKTTSNSSRSSVDRESKNSPRKDSVDATAEPDDDTASERPPTPSTGEQYPTLATLYEEEAHDSEKNFRSYLRNTESDEVLRRLVQEIFDLLGYEDLQTDSGTSYFDILATKSGLIHPVKVFYKNEIDDVDLELLSSSLEKDQVAKCIVVTVQSLPAPETTLPEDSETIKIINEAELQKLAKGAISRINEQAESSSE